PGGPRHSRPGVRLAQLLGGPRASCRAEPLGTSSFYPRVPQFADEGASPGAAEMFVAVKHGNRGTGRGAWAVNLKDEGTWPIVWFLQRLRSLPPEVEAVWRTP